MTESVQILNRILFFGMFFLGIASLLFDFGTSIGISAAFIGFLTSFVILFLLKRREVYTSWYWLLVNIGIWIHIIGQYGLYYHSFSYYDKIVHLFFGFVIASIIRRYFHADSEKNKSTIVLTTLGLLTLWEMYEYILFAYFDSPTMGVTQDGILVMGPLEDTILDLFFGFLGSVFYLFIYLLFGKSKKFKI